jgi:nicotinamide riboside kinase
MALTGIVILDGANATGKSTLAAELARKHDGVVMHQTYRFRNKIFDYHTAVIRRAVKLSMTRLVILDRLWLSEFIYAEVYRGGTPWPLQGRFVERVLAKTRAITVVCASTDSDKLRQRYVANRQDRTDASAVKNLEINERYLGVPSRFNKWFSRYPLLYDMDEVSLDLMISVIEQYIAIASPLPDLIDDDNFVGPISADTLMVGDRPNAKHRWTWPFYEYNNCSLWLMTQLEKLGVWERELMWTNVCADTSTITRLGNMGILGGVRILALGQNAAVKLKEIGLTEFRVISHPQYARRFEHEGSKYRDDLTSALQNVELI